MPGVVKAIECTVEETVEAGTPLVTLEAMKMQNPLLSPKSGKVGRESWPHTTCTILSLKIKEISVKVGDNVGEDDVLLTFYS